MLETENSWKPDAKSQAQATWEGWVKQEEELAEVVEPKSGSHDPLRRGGRAAGDRPRRSRITKGRTGFRLRRLRTGRTSVQIRAIMTRVWDRKRSRPDDTKRKYLNWPVVTEDAWCDPQVWATRAQPRELVDGERIVLFFDGSKTPRRHGVRGLLSGGWLCLHGGGVGAEGYGACRCRADRQPNQRRLRKIRCGGLFRRCSGVGGLCQDHVAGSLG